MIRRVINCDNYWKVVIYYNVDYNFFDIISNELEDLGCTDDIIDILYYNLKKKAKAVTISKPARRRSVVLFNVHNSYYDYINSIAHEAEHVKQSMLKYYRVKDDDEPPAYTIGFLVMKMIFFLNDLLKI